MARPKHEKDRTQWDLLLRSGMGDFSSRERFIMRMALDFAWRLDVLGKKHSHMRWHLERHKGAHRRTTIFISLVWVMLLLILFVR